MKLTDLPAPTRQGNLEAGVVCEGCRRTLYPSDVVFAVRIPPLKRWGDDGRLVLPSMLRFCSLDCYSRAKKGGAPPT